MHFNNNFIRRLVLFIDEFCMPAADEYILRHNFKWTVKSVQLWYVDGFFVWLNYDEESKVVDSWPKFGTLLSMERTNTRRGGFMDRLFAAYLPVLVGWFERKSYCSVLDKGDC